MSTASIKEVFIPASSSNCLVEADYSSLEIRVLALASNCKQLIEDLNSGLDMHTVFAAKIFGIHESDVTPKQRRMAKAFTFELQYGASAHSIAKHWRVPLRMTRTFIKEYFARYPEITTFHNKITAEVYSGAQYAGEDIEVDGCLRSVQSSVLPNIFNLPDFGGFHMREEPTPWDKSRMTFSPTMIKNLPIQGGAADIIHIVLGELYRRVCTDERLRPVILLGTIHDSILFEFPVRMRDSISIVLKDIMEDVPRYLKEIMNLDSPVPFPTEWKWGFTWADMEVFEPRA